MLRTVHRLLQFSRHNIVTESGVSFLNFSQILVFFESSHIENVVQPHKRSLYRNPTQQKCVLAEKVASHA